MAEAVIVDAVRTPIGRAGKGSLKDMRADELAAVPLKALQERGTFRSHPLLAARVLRTDTGPTRFGLATGRALGSAVLDDGVADVGADVEDDAGAAGGLAEEAGLVGEAVAVVGLTAGGAAELVAGAPEQRFDHPPHGAGH